MIYQEQNLVEVDFGQLETNSKKVVGAINEVNGKVDGLVGNTTVTLSAASWSNKQQVVSVSGLTSTNTVIVSPAPAYIDTYVENGIYCSAQSTGSLTFKCNEVPSGNITVNITIL